MTENLSRLKSVRRIVVLPPLTPRAVAESAPESGTPSGAPEGAARAPKKKKKKQSWLLRPLERAARTLVKAQVVAAETYLEAHDRSTRKEKDGWVIDLGRNAGRAWRAGVKQLKRPL